MDIRFSIEDEINKPACSSFLKSHFQKATLLIFSYVVIETSKGLRNSNFQLFRELFHIVPKNCCFLIFDITGREIEGKENDLLEEILNCLQEEGKIEVICFRSEQNPYITKLVNATLIKKC